tara:strand:- start:452 stop:1579 length:1128 start_codon:yes stop_codon:yes gene_type:complete
MLYYGVVEDRMDPLKIGRVRVRVLDVHTHQKTKIATPDLPWSMVMMPPTIAGFGGFGQTHSLVEGTHVVGMFTDNDFQQFVVLGVHQGITKKGVIVNEDGYLLVVNRQNQHEIGFSDPRIRGSFGDGIDTYEGRPDGKNPEHFPQRTHGLKITTHGLVNHPALPESLEISYDQTSEGTERSKINEENDDDKKTPYYPLKTDQTDLNDFTGRVIGGKESRIDQVISSQELYEKGLLQRDLSQADEELFVGASIPRLPVYPFNKVNYTESGHLFELDDSPGNERVSLGHRSGTYFEYNANGDAERRVVNDNYTVICGNDTLYVGGKVNIKVLGDATLNVGGDLKASVTGKSKIDSGDSLTVVAPEISLQGTVVKLNS